MPLRTVDDVLVLGASLLFNEQRSDIQQHEQNYYGNLHLSSPFTIPSTKSAHQAKHVPAPRDCHEPHTRHIESIHGLTFDL